MKVYQHLLAFLWQKKTKHFSQEIPSIMGHIKNTKCKMVGVLMIHIETIKVSYPNAQILQKQPWPSFQQGGLADRLAMYRLLSECSVFLDKARSLNCGDNGRNQAAKLYWGRGGGRWSLNSSKLKM